MKALVAELPARVVMLTGEYSAEPVTSPIGQVNGIPVPAEMKRIKLPVPSVTIILLAENGEPLMEPENEIDISKLPR